MIEFMKKSMLTGIGFALQTKKEIEDLSKEFVEKSKLSEEEGRKFMDEMMDKYHESKTDFEELVKKSINEILDKTELATRKEVEELKNQVESLKKELAGKE